MKLSDIKMQELIERPLFWEDFEEDRQDKGSMKALIERDSEAVRKIAFLDQGQLQKA